ncbi:MAG: hypothetical protein HRT37_06870 [Alteromonadaceae bacterium]|nr:hypothetical protein [Alteromonadaceae bacterium]
MTRVYKAELDDEKPVYGIRKALASWNPVWANLDTYYCLAQDAWHTKNWRDKQALWVKPTGWRPQDVQKSHPRKYTQPKNLTKFDIVLPPAGKVYVSLQHVLILALSLAYLMLSPEFSVIETSEAAGFLVLSMVSLSGVQEKREQGFIVETVRLIATAALLWQWSEPLWLKLVLLSTFTLCMLTLYQFYRQCNAQLISQANTSNSQQ